MKKLLICLVLAIVLGFGTQVLAEQQYNPWTGHWETVPDESNYRPRYNPYEDTWSLQPEQAEPEYNPYEDRWEWNQNPYNTQPEKKYRSW